MRYFDEEGAPLKKISFDEAKQIVAKIHCLSQLQLRKLVNPKKVLNTGAGNYPFTK